MSDLGMLLDVKEVAAQLGVSERGVLRLIDRKRFPPPFVIGSHVRWCQRDVDAFLWLVARGLVGGRGPADDPDEG